MAKRYRAFISYAHADQRFALWLQRQLESYVVPRRLRKSDPSLPARLHPVFLDKQELASSDDLGDAIRQALAESAALIVVCSPAAAVSRWVNQEIRLFRELSPRATVLCLMVSGSPDPAAPDCAFPPALLAMQDGAPLPEPLAADLRSQGDGKRGALLKIVAGLLGTGIDALRRRDHQRRIRWLGAITAFACTVAGITLVLALIAVNSRNEANLRRAQAEELIEFMLTDLRAQLEPDGRLSLLDSVGNQAMEYFSALGDLGTPKELLMRALSLRQIGEVRFQQHYLESALRAFEESHRLTRTLYERYPEDNEILFEHSQSEFWIGYVAWKRHNLAAASDAFARYHRFSAELAERDPGAQNQLELSYAESNLGAVAREMGDLETAGHHFIESVTLTRQLLAASPDDASLQYDLSEALSFLASTYLESGNLPASEATFREAFSILAGLHQRETGTRHSRGLGDVATLLGDVQLHMGKAQEARESYRKALDVFSALVDFDPDNAESREGYYRSSNRWGQLALVSGRAEEARTWLETARRGFQDLLALDASNYTIIDRLAQAEAHLAMLAVEEGELPAALSLSAQAHEHAASMIGDNRVSSSNSGRVVQVLSIRARVLATLGRQEEALELVAEALALLDRKRGATVTDKALMADLYRLQGNDTLAAGYVRELAAIGFRDPRYPGAIAQPRQED